MTTAKPTAPPPPEFMAEFKIEPKTLDVRAKLHEMRCRGEFEDAITLMKGHLATKPQPGYDPTRGQDPTLLELHNIAATCYDNRGKYEQARQFVWRWGADLIIEADGVLNEFDALRRDPMSNLPDPSSAHIASTMPVPKFEDLEWLYQKSWCLQRCGVVAYRMGKLTRAMEFLDAARDMCLVVWRSSHHYRRDKNILYPALLERATMLAANYYWRGCVQMYLHELEQAEQTLLDGLSIINHQVVQRTAQARDANNGGAGEKDASFADVSDDFAAYITARLMMTSGLVKYFSGSLQSAKSDLLAASIFFHQHYGDEVRRLRATMLLLSVERMLQVENREKLEAVRRDLEGLKEEIAKHSRYFTRLLWTIGETRVDLTRFEKDGKKKIADLKDVMDGELKAAVKSKGDFRDVLNDFRLELLKVRINRKIGTIAMAEGIPLERDYIQEAIDGGKELLLRHDVKERSMLRVDTLIALGHAYYEKWSAEKDEASLKGAQACYEEARILSEANPRARAVCDLNLARVFDSLGMTSEARQHFENWKLTENLVEHPHVRRFGDIVRAKLSGSSPSLTFSLSKLPKEKAYEKLDHELRRFLFYGLTKTMSMDTAATQLGLSRQTLYKWRDEIEQRQKRIDQPE